MILKHGKVTVNADAPEKQRIVIENFNFNSAGDHDYCWLNAQVEGMQWAIAMLQQEIQRVSEELRSLPPIYQEKGD